MIGTPARERVPHLSPLEVWFWDVEDAANLQHIGSVAAFEGPEPDLSAFRARLGEVLPRVRRYRQRAVPVPLALGRPVLVDSEVDLTYHVRRTALPAPGGDRELDTLVGRVMSQPLDRTRPLWEAWVVSGLADGRWALLSKVHHCIVDGVAGTDLMAALFDLGPEPEPGPPDDRVMVPPPSRTALVADALRGALADPASGARIAVRALRHPTTTVRSGMRLARGVVDLASTAVPATGYGLNGPVGSHRVYAHARTRISDVRAVRGTTGATFNDVALAAVAAGFRSLLLHRGIDLPRQARVRTMVPVSVRSEDERGCFDNRVSTMFVALPVGLTDPAERLARVREETAHHKSTGEAAAGASLLALLGYLPAALVEPATRLVARQFNHRVQHGFATVTTNVPGPDQPLYVLGRRMVELLPYVLVGEGLTVGVAMFSYDGALTFGVTGDVDASPDVEVLARAIEDGMAELVAAVTS